MHLDQLIPAAAILLAVSVVLVSVFKRLGLGSVLGFLAAGVVAGPSGLALTTEVGQLREFTELGVVLLLFLIGIEMQPRKLWSMRLAVFGLGTAQVLVTGVLVAGYFLVLGVSFQVSVLLGMGLALSSTAFVLQLLGERGDMATPHGRNAFAILLLQDLAIVPLLALVPILAGHAEPAGGALWTNALAVAGAIAGVVLFGRHVVPFLLGWMARRRNMEAFAMVAALAVFGAAWAMKAADVSMALGAFLVGMLLSACEFRHQVEAIILPFKGLLLGLFFIAVGMSVDIGPLAGNLPEIAGHVTVLMAVKAAALFGLCLLFGIGRATAMRTALLLSQFGEFGFVLFSAALAAGLIGQGLFAVVIAGIAISMLATPPLARLGDALAARFKQAAPAPGDVSAPAAQERPVVIAGYGRVGRVICHMLTKAELPYLAYDLDAELVRQGRARGHNVHWGDMRNFDLLRAARLGEAAALVVTLAEPNEARRLIAAVRAAFPGIAIHARARDLGSRHALLAAGVRGAVPEVAEASLSMGSFLLSALGVADPVTEDMVADLRREDYALLRDLEMTPPPSPAAHPSTGSG
ncbi:cation:proton antiporter domain-containing protein [Shumkonia mesophila]|uniref:cation:proton antiporter domain-containing protein n=1 Tax=Shumkonia mesophila TaxID=2838854 RepID=UPI0029349C71|nr:cation:proton antiporter [Shumkonia mesophila]